MNQTSTPEQRLHRCFYAVRLDAATEQILAGLIEELKTYRASIGWVAQRNLHLTLRFLGEITDAQLDEALRLPVAGTPRGFSLRIAGLGAYPGLRNPRVIWAGVDGATLDDRQHLEHLQKQTERWARQLRLPPENKRYSPHITLGRPRRPFENLRELIDDVAVRELHAGPVRVDELHLIRSTLAPGGSMYETVGRWELIAGG